MQIVPLELLAAGDEGRICDIIGEQEFITRLHEMGLRTGVAMRMIKPGRPCIIGIDHQRLSFRVEDDFQVLVEVTGNASAIPA